MTPQEKSMIDELVERIRTTPVTDKDNEAEHYLQQILGGIPDALYVLTQTVLVQQYGLTQAQSQLQARQEELDELKRQNASAESAPKSGGSFLSRIFGSDESHAAPASGGAGQDPSGYQRVNYAPAPGSLAPPPPGAPGYGGPVYGGAAYGGAPAYGGSYGGPAYGGQPMSMPGGFGGGGGFLRGALQTAAGVAAGEMAFRGMEDLFHGFGGGGEGRGLVGGPGESVVNNYYEGDSAAGGNRDEGRADSSFYNPGHDASRENLGDDKAGDSRGFGAFGNDSDSSSQFADTDAPEDNDTGGFSDSNDSDDNDSNDVGDDGSDNGGGDDSNY